MYIISLLCVCLTNLGTISLQEERLQIFEEGRKQKVESKRSQFEIEFKSLACFSTQFRVKESFKVIL